MSSTSDWKAGASVRIVGLRAASQHNGKVGRLTAKAGADGRVGVDIGEGSVLAVKRENLELLSAPQTAATSSNESQQRTLKRDDSLLREFYSSGDPDLLALYWHINDRAFDCFNASEYTTQMLRYYANVPSQGIQPLPFART